MKSLSLCFWNALGWRIFWWGKFHLHVTYPPLRASCASLDFEDYFSPVLANLLLIKLLCNFGTVFAFFSLSIHFFFFFPDSSYEIPHPSKPPPPLAPKSTPAHIHFWLWNHPRPLQKTRTRIFTPPPHLILATKPIFPACVISPSSR